MAHKGFRVPGLGLFTVLMSAETPKQPEKPSLPPPPPPPPWIQLVEKNQTSAPQSTTNAQPAPTPQPATAAAPPAAQSPMPPAAAAAEPPAQAPPSPAQPAEPKLAPVPPQLELAQVAEKKVREYRYMTRILKSMFLPLFFGLMSFWMLYNYVNGFEPYYKYDFEIIAGGFLLGLVAMNGFVMYNMRRAKREGKCAARQTNGILILLAFLVPYLYYILLVNPAGAWRFSIGFFLSAVVTPMIVKAYESYTRGKFFIQEEEVDDRLTRTLIFRS
jgi:hypothetical protein